MRGRREEGRERGRLGKVKGKREGGKNSGRRKRVREERERGKENGCEDVEEGIDEEGDCGGWEYKDRQT